MKVFNVTYDIVTEESAKYGDSEEDGFICQGVSLRDAVDALLETPGYLDCAEQVDHTLRVCHRPDYQETEDHHSRTLHVPDSVSIHSMRRLAKVLGAYSDA